MNQQRIEEVPVTINTNSFKNVLFLNSVECCKECVFTFFFFLKRWQLYLIELVIFIFQGTNSNSVKWKQKGEERI